MKACTLALKYVQMCVNLYFWPLIAFLLHQRGGLNACHSPAETIYHAFHTDSDRFCVQTMYKMEKPAWFPNDDWGSSMPEGGRENMLNVFAHMLKYFLG